MCEGPRRLCPCERVPRGGGQPEREARQHGLISAGFYVWKNVMPLSAGETDTVQIQVTLCRGFSSF